MHTFNRDLMRATILAHYENPYHKETPQNADEFMQIHLNSTGCIDDITLYLKVVDGVVKVGYFDGFGCTISIASTSILLEMIEGMNIEKVLEIINEYHKMLNAEQYDADMLDEAIVFMNTMKQPSRIRCATIGWDGAKELILKYKEGEK
ncbi:MAG: SUF system NifU family Fe-S cluster assembly protein [Bacilli bacterium]|nr:SUF system NifU family Fe-S cluster assembly protein [Bacilli bacterium]